MLLVLIDGNGLMHRAFHALPPLTNRSGQPVGALHGFSGMIYKIITELKPTHLACCFDSVGPTFRTAEYIAYKAQRKATDEALVPQLVIAPDLIENFGIAKFAISGYEADDIIATLSDLSHNGIPTIVVSADRDLFQLIDENVQVYAPRKGLSDLTIFDEQKVFEEFGLRPKQIADYKALRGDASDNYSGIEGIGEKTAVRLLQAFDTIENIYSAVKKYHDYLSDEVDISQSKDPEVVKLREFNPTIVTKLAEGIESCGMSKRLATLAHDVPLSTKIEGLEIHFDPEKASEYLLTLGLRSLSLRVLKKEGEENEPKQKKKKENEDQLSLI